MEKEIKYLIELMTKERAKTLLMKRQLIDQETILESIKRKVLDREGTDKVIVKVLKSLLEQNGYKYN